MGRHLGWLVQTCCGPRGSQLVKQLAVFPSVYPEKAGIRMALPSKQLFHLNNLSPSTRKITIIRHHFGRQVRSRIDGVWKQETQGVKHVRNWWSFLQDIGGLDHDVRREKKPQIKHNTAWNHRRRTKRRRYLHEVVYHSNLQAKIQIELLIVWQWKFRTFWHGDGFWNKLSKTRNVVGINCTI